MPQNMNKQKQRVLAVAAIAGAGTVLAVGLGLAGSNGIPRLPAARGATDLYDIQQRLDAMERRQTERLDALERRLNQLSAAVPRALTRADIEQRRRDKAARIAMLSDPVKLAQLRRNQLNELNSEFLKEPVDPVWARETSVFIKDALTFSGKSTNLKPENSQVECRSSRCQISFDLPTDVDVEDLMMPLATNLSESLGKTRSVLIPSADGRSVRTYVFAEQWRSRPLRRDDG